MLALDVARRQPRRSVGGLRRVAFTLLAAVLIGALLVSRVVSEGRAELERSDAAFDRGDLREAVLHGRRAAALHVPGAPHVEAAFARLVAVAVGAEATGDREMARLAWGAVRGAALESEHVVNPRAADLARADANLARLGAGPGSALDRTRLAELLARRDSPAPVWVVLLAVGAALFAAGVAWFAWRGAALPARARVKHLAVAFALAVAGVACWTFAVYRA